MKTKLLILAILSAVTLGLCAAPYNGRSAFIAIGDGAAKSNRLAYATWVNGKLGDVTDSNAVIRIWKLCARVALKANTNKLGWMRCVNIDRLHADGRLKNYKPDAHLERRAYQAATNIMGADARFVWIKVTDDMTAWTNVFTRVKNE